MKRLLAIVLILGLAMPVMAKKHQSEEIITPLTQLEKRSFQTKTYNAQNQNAVLKSILNVLQDEGYMVYNVNSLLGFAYAVKDFDTTDPNIDISKEFGLTKSRLNYNGVKVATLEANANITQYGETIRVRINFKRKLLNEYGNAQFIDDVSEPEFYDEFYAKLDQAIALHKDLNTPKIVPDKEVAKPEILDNTQEVIITPDLMKEINDNVEKIINSDAPKIPELSEQTEATSIIKEEPKKEEKKIEKHPSKDKEEIKPEKNIEKTEEIQEETSKKDKKIKENKEKTEEISEEKSTQKIKEQKEETKKSKNNKKEKKDEEENNK